MISDEENSLSSKSL